MIDDGQFARLARDRCVPIGPPAGRSTAADHTLQPAVCLVLQVAHPQLPHQSPKSDAHNVGPSLVDCLDADAGEFETFVDARQIALVAGQAVERFHDHHIERLGLGLRQQIHDAVPADQGGGRLGPILKRRDDVEALTPSEVPTHGDLVAYGLVGL
ncbi:MAG: hypothetical protein AAGF30_00545 [Pseudomonadota bacterium]